MMKKLLIIILTLFTLYASAQVPDTIRIKVHGGGGLSESKIAQMISDSLSKMDLSIYTKQQVDSITAVLRSEIQVAAGGGITKAQLDSAANLKLNITDLPGNVSYFNNDVPYLKAVDIANKVDKTTTVNGHPLSSNVTVTNTDVGLGNVPNIDATNPSNIVQTSVYRFVTDTDKTNWNGKLNISDTSNMLSKYLRSVDATNTYATIANLNLKANDNAVVHLTGKEILDSKVLNNSYTGMAGEQGGTLGMTGLYDRNELTNAGVRGSVVVYINNVLNTSFGNNNIFVDGSAAFGNFPATTGSSDTVKIICSLPSKVANYSHGAWQPFVAYRLASMDYYKYIRVQVSEDSVTWSDASTSGAWTLPNGAPLTFGGTWMGGESAYGGLGWKYVRFIFANPNAVDGYVFISEIGMRHISAPYARQYLLASGDDIWGKMYYHNLRNWVGNFITRDPTSGELAERTPSQALSDMGGVSTSANNTFTGNNTFSGTNTAVTPTASDNSTKIATTAFVKNQNYLTSVTRQLMQIGFGATATSGANNWNNLANTQPGSTSILLLGSDTSGMGGSSYFHPFNFEYAYKDGTGNVTQFAIPYSDMSSKTIYMRGRYNGSWSSWYKFYTSGNFIADADYLTPSTASSTYVPKTTTINSKALSGGNISLTPTDIGAEPAFTKNTAFNKNFGRTLNTVVDGKEFIDSLTALNARKVDTSFKQPLGLLDPVRYDSANKKIYMRQTWLDSIRNSSFATVNFGMSNLDANSFRTTKDFVIDNAKGLYFSGQGNLYQNAILPLNNYNGGMYTLVNSNGANSGVANRENMVWTPTGTGIDGINIPTAKVEFPASSGNAGDAPIKLHDGPLMPTPEDGAIEKNNGRLYTTNSSAERDKITYESDLKAYLTKDSIGNRNYANDSLAVIDGGLGLYDFYRTGNIVKIVAAIPQFTLTYTVDNTAGVNDSTSFHIGLSVSNKPLYVDWGDGATTIDSTYGNGDNLSHKYSLAGTYTVRLSMTAGVEQKITTFWVDNYPYATKITSVTNLGKLTTLSDLSLDATQSLDASTYDFEYPSTLKTFGISSAGLTTFLPTHNLPAGLTLLNISNNTLTPTDVDNTLIWMDGQTFNAGAKTLHIEQGGTAPPTSASSAAITSLQSKGWTITHD